MQTNQTAESFETNNDLKNCSNQIILNEEEKNNVELIQNIQNFNLTQQNNQNEQNKAEQNQSQQNNQTLQNQALNGTKFINVGIIRMFACLSIIVCHMLQFWTDFGRVYFPFYFAVQIFLFISGFLYSKKQIKSVKSFYIKNAVKICVPTAIFLAVFGIIYLICAICGYHVAVFNIVSPAGEVVDSIGHLWFIYAILICYFLTPFLSKFISLKQEKNKSKKQKTQYVFLILLIIFAILIDILLFSFTNSQSMIIPYICGYFFKFSCDKLNNLKQNLWLLLLSPIFFCGFWALYYFAPSIKFCWGGGYHFYCKTCQL